jgi:dihydrofolate reductase
VSVASGAERARAATWTPRIALVLIAAVAENGVIGRSNKLPWRLKSDMRRFRALTMGKPVVMGRKTFRSLFKPLEGRTVVVLTRDRSFTAPGIIVACGMDAALEAAHGDALRRGASAVMVAGGAELYAQLMPVADRLLITEVHDRPEGDAVFPAIDDAIWHEVARAENPAGPHDSAAFAFVEFERRVG